MSESLGRLYRSLTLLPQLSRTEATTSAAAESNGHKSPEPGSDRADEDQLPPLSGYESVIIARGSEAERIFYPDDGSRTPNSDNDNGTGNGNGTVSRPQCKPGNGHPRRGKHARHSHAVTNPVPTASEILGLPGSWLSSQETEAQAKWDTTDGSGGIAVVVAEESAPARSERAPTERMDETVLKRSMVALDSFVGKYIRIWIAGPRLFIGVVAMFDRDSNFVLRDAWEVETTPEPVPVPASPVGIRPFGCIFGTHRSQPPTPGSVYLASIVILGKDIVKIEIPN